MPFQPGNNSCQNLRSTHEVTEFGSNCCRFAAARFSRKTPVRFLSAAVVDFAFGANPNRKGERPGKVLSLQRKSWTAKRIGPLSHSAGPFPPEKSSTLRQILNPATKFGHTQPLNSFLGFVISPHLEVEVILSSLRSENTWCVFWCLLSRSHKKGLSVSGGGKC